MWVFEVLFNSYSCCSGTDKEILFSSLFCDSEIDTCIGNCNTHIAAIHIKVQFTRNCRCWCYFHLEQ